MIDINKFYDEVVKELSDIISTMDKQKIEDTLSKYGKKVDELPDDVIMMEYPVITSDYDENEMVYEIEFYTDDSENKLFSVLKKIIITDEDDDRTPEEIINGEIISIWKLDDLLKEDVTVQEFMSYIKKFLI